MRGLKREFNEKYMTFFTAFRDRCLIFCMKIPRIITVLLTLLVNLFDYTNI